MNAMTVERRAIECGGDLQIMDDLGGAIFAFANPTCNRPASIWPASI
jgi:hypothetical protein